MHVLCREGCMCWDECSIVKELSQAAYLPVQVLFSWQEIWGQGSTSVHGGRASAGTVSGTQWGSLTSILYLVTVYTSSCSLLEPSSLSSFLFLFEDSMLHHVVLKNEGKKRWKSIPDIRGLTMRIGNQWAEPVSACNTNRQQFPLIPMRK